jgi:hypothetical protein
MVFKHGGYPGGVTWEGIELVHTRRAESEELYLRFNLLRFRRWGKAGRSTSGVRYRGECNSIGCRGWVTSDRRAVNCEDVRRAVVEAVSTLKIKLHSDEAVVTVESDLARASVLETCLRPGDEDITGGEDCLRRDDGFYRILAKEAHLPMCRAIGEGQRKISLTSTRVIQLGGVAIHGHRYGEWQNFNNVNQNIEIARKKDVGATIDQRRRCLPHLDIRGTIVPEAKHSG